MRPLASVVAFVLLLAACSSGPEIRPEEQIPRDQVPDGTETPPDATDQEQILTFVAGDIFYDDPPTTARAGTLTIVIDNIGQATHNVVFEGFNDEQPVAEATGGQSDRGSITLDPGTYTFYCSIPGHREAGMEGTLEVAE
jgi:plastocyanin